MRLSYTMTLLNLSALPNIVYTKNNKLLKFRLWLNGFALIHQLVMAIKLLSINFRDADDPKLWPYQQYKWKFITAWFNILILGYLPISIYCDWRELNGKTDQRHVKVLNQVRFICFTSMILPTTAFSDILFWRLWNKNRELVVPAFVDTLVPLWAQHCMHTASLIFVILDLVLVPRRRPDNLILGLVPMFIFIGSYAIMLLNCVYNEEYIYPVLKLLSPFKLFLLAMFTFLENCFYYTCQWFIIDMIWDKHNNVKPIKSHGTLSGSINPVAKKHYTRRQISRLSYGA
ncbi:androgen-dependent TFPI-regulating protein-like [Galleria mellonella]|uniref:Androgen-dependent TFPI-regulating protein-like n=1 Tax=Galleria mellonella TaxID=7137 RepID=A0A6J1WKQ5_GALME|nr:androgen-dependent TFPI-regulating protein-like [Galleria mellonella]